MMKQNWKEDAVSPVIGVILLVSITIILAAITAAFVTGIAGQQLQTKHMVSATAVKSDAGHISVTYVGGNDAKSCTGIYWTTATSTDSIIDTVLMGKTIGSDPVPVGTTASLDAKETTTHLVGTAYFMDGSQQVILDSRL